MFQIYKIKDKIPKNMSYIVNTQILTEYFKNIPQVSEMKIWYNNRPLGYEVSLQKILQKKLSYPILIVRYSILRPAPTCLKREQSLSHNWYFLVYPVEQAKKCEYQSLLIKLGFPKLISWLCQKRSTSWFDSSKQFSCILDIQGKEDSTIILKEN